MKKTVTWIEKPSPERLDSVWYGGDMVKIDTDRFTFTIQAVGDIRIHLDGEYYCDKSNGGRMKEYLEEHGILNDEQLAKAEEDGRLDWGNNNWYEMEVYDKEKKKYIETYDTCDLDPNDDFKWVKDAVAWAKRGGCEIDFDEEENG